MPVEQIRRCQNRANIFLKRILGWLPARIALAVMSWFGFVNFYMVRVNLSIAIIAMAKRNIAGGREAVCVARLRDTNNGSSEMQSNLSDASTSAPASSDYLEGEFTWDETTQGWILGAFFYGYIFSQAIGGRLAELYGAKIVFGTAILAGGISALLSPLFARWHYGGLIALRVVQGFFQGPTWPAMHACISRWIPPAERTIYVAIVYMAATLSTGLTLPLCGLIIANHGWEAQFYVIGCLSLLFCCVWFPFMHNTPEEHPRISEEEKTYIVDELRESGTKKSISKKVPWRAIFTSLPVWATLVYAVGNSWGVTLFYTQLPTYMRNVLGFSLKSNGALSASPFIARYLGSLLFGTLAYYMLSRKYISVTNTRRVFTIISQGVPALVLVGFVISGCNATAAVPLMCLALFCNGAAVASGFVNQTDIAPNFAGTIVGIGTTLDAGMSAIVPVVTGFITQGQQTLEAWQKVFWVCVPIYLISTILTVCFVSGEVQPWNDIDFWNAERASKSHKYRDGVQEDTEETVHLKRDHSQI